MLADTSTPTASANVTARRVPGAGLLAFAVAWTTSLLVLRRLIMIVMVGPLFVGRALGVRHLARRRPFLAVTACTLLGVVVCTHGVFRYLVAQPYGAILYPLVVGVTLSAFNAAVWENIMLIPMTYADIDESNRRWPDRWLSARMRRSEDAVIARLYARLSVPVLPFLVLAIVGEAPIWVSLLFYTGATWPATALVEALDHADLHTDVFHWRHLKGTDRFVFRVLEIYAQWVFTFLYWRMPQWYPVQHVAVHHAEDNSAEDTQSTLGLDRTRFAHFCWSALSFSLSSMFAHDVIAYLLRKGRSRQLRRLISGMIGYYCAIALIAWISPVVAILLVVMRLRLSVAAALLYFTWHALFERNDPQNAFTNSVNFVAESEHGFFGASLHIEHHLRPALHWSQVARLAEKNRQKHIEHGSLLFTSALTPRPYLQSLWARDFERLLKFVVPLEGDHRGDADLLEVIRSRSGADDEPDSQSGRLELALGRAVAATLL